MPTVAVPLTNLVAVNIKTALSLAEGTAYSIQARGENILLTEQASAPTIGAVPTHLLEGDGPTGTYTPKTGEALYAWAQFRACSLVVTEV